MIPALRIRPPGCVPIQRRRHQSWHETIELDARIAQPGHPHPGGVADAKHRIRRQPEQVNAARQDVLADLAGPDSEAFGFEFLQQLPVQQMHLAQIRLRRIARDPDRCFTVVPACASPSTPSPASRVIHIPGSLLK